MANYADRTAHVKPFLEIGANDTTHDAVLDILIEDASVSIDKMLNVDSLERATYVDERFTGNTNVIHTRNFNIISVTEIKEGSQETLYTQVAGYLLDKNRVRIDGVVGGGKDYEESKITYVAGYITYEQSNEDGGAFEGNAITLPPDLRRACILLAAGFYNERQNIGVKSFTMQGQTVNFRNDDESKEYERIMKRYKKPIIKDV